MQTASAAPATSTGPASLVAQLARPELGRPSAQHAQPSKRALIMAASMMDTKQCWSRGSSSSSSSSSSVQAGASKDGSSRPTGGDDGRPMTVGRRQMLNHLQVLDQLNRAYYDKNPEQRSRKIRKPASQEGLQAADWVVQVLGYQMSDKVRPGHMS